MILMTSLREIRSFSPCVDGWSNIVKAKGNCNYNVQFPITDCLSSNSVNDVLWLLGKRAVEVRIIVQFAKNCAARAAAYAADADAAAAAYAATAATAAAADAADAAYPATAAADAAAAAYPATAAAAYAAYAAYGSSAVDAATRAEIQKQKEDLAQFLNNFSTAAKAA